MWFLVAHFVFIVDERERNSLVVADKLPTSLANSTVLLLSFLFYFVCVLALVLYSKTSMGARGHKTRHTRCS